jgi:hypothetical protein
MRATANPMVDHTSHRANGATPTVTRKSANETKATMGIRIIQRPSRHPTPPAAKINHSIDRYSRNSRGCTQLSGIAFEAFYSSARIHDDRLDCHVAGEPSPSNQIAHLTG